MYFTKGKQRAFELIMQQKPGFDRYQSGCAGDDEDCGIGIVGAVVIRLIVYFKGKNARKYRKGAEYGSARWSA